MEMRDINFRVIVITVIILSAFFVIFNWTMSAVIHSKKDVIVPDLQGKSIYEALTLASAQGFALKKEAEEFDKSLPAGVILRQSPPAGMKVKEGKVLRVTISQGGESAFVPDLVGQKARSAALTIRSYGLVLGEESSRYSVVYDKDTIIEQDPPKGTAVSKDTMINIVVSLGAPPNSVILMPKFIGKNITDVNSWADNNGIKVNVAKENISTAVTDSVIEQSPEPDSELKPNQTIDVKIVGAEDSASK